ncbi:hypothetical protein CALVIDRAFT_569391 [Calocera viscosa TUFC12733]|uniref:HNH nuclease domain-containing protein n=1 Tax=Calocera viscosa (strain TUFC12733) TaxID=1330018 RepID=A0A167G1C2_CALVF|nr:hypothetical protein CALVIDRAFT_569391 [Calocera viscosa TUFC12733]
MNARLEAYGTKRTPLPANPLPQWGHEIRKAYTLCTTQEQAAIQRDSDQDTVLIRLLGYLLRFCPPEGLASLTTEINSSKGNTERLIALGMYWKDAFLGVSPSSHPTRDSVIVTTDAVRELLTPGPLDYRRSKELALRHHRNCCALSRKHGITADEQEWNPVENPGRAQLNCAMSGPNGLDKGKLTWAATCLAVLAPFLGDNAADDVLHHFNGDNVHDLRNVFIATRDLHGMFDGMYICLEARAEANMYTLKQVVGGTLDHQLIDKILDMNSPYPNIPAVSPEFLALHRACAIVAHLSGAGELLEKEERDREPDNRHELPAGGGKQSREWDLFQYRLTSISVQ